MEKSALITIIYAPAFCLFLFGLLAGLKIAIHKKKLDKLCENFVNI